MSLRLMQLGLCCQLLLVAAPAAGTDTPQPSDFARHYQHLHFQEVPLALPAFGKGFLQDRDGFIWLGLQSGLAKWDGVHLHLYDTRNSQLSSLTVTGLLEDRDGLIWVETQGGGLNVYDKSSNRFRSYRHEAGDPSSVASDSLGSTDLVQTMVEDAQGRIWVASTDDGLSALDKRSGHFTRYQHREDDPDSLANDSVTALLRDHLQRLWIGTSHGLDLMEPDHAGFRHVGQRPGMPGALQHGRIMSLHEDHQGRMWIGTESDGLICIDASGHRATQWSANGHSGDAPALATISSIAEDDAGVLWLAHKQNQLSFFDPQSGHFAHVQADETAPDRMRGTSIDSVVHGAQGVMWVMDHSGRLDKYDAGATKFALFHADPTDRHSLAENKVAYVHCEDDGVLWLDNGVGGLLRYDPHQDSFDRYPLAGRTHRPMFKDHRGQVWFGGTTADGAHGALHLLDLQHMRYAAEYILPEGHPSVRMIADPRDPDRLWFTTVDHGLGLFDIRTHRFRSFVHDAHDPDSIASNSLWDLAVDRDDPGVLWIGTFGGGLARFDTRTERFQSFVHNPRDPTSIASNVVFSFVQSSRSGFWVMAKGGALDQFDKHNGRFTHYSQLNGHFPDDKAVNVLEDAQGMLWLNSPGGHIIRFDPRDGSSRSYAAGDGIQTGAAWGGANAACPNGTLWFGGGRGLNGFDPGQIRDLQLQPQVYLTSLTQGGDPIATEQAPERISRVQLDWRNNFFEFEAASLDFTHPEQNRYQYKLEGWDKDWYQAGTLSRGRYSGLPGGDYVLRVRGSNADGLWSPHEVRLEVSVAPPMWQRGWFVYGMASLLGASLLAALYWRTASIRAHNRELVQAVEQRTAELHQAMARLVQAQKLAALGHLVAGMAHELNTPLGNARLVGSSLDNELQTLEVAMNNGTISRSQLVRFLESGKQGLALLERNTARAAQLIDNFKLLALDQESSERRRFMLRALVEGTLLRYDSQLSKSSHRVTLEIPANLSLDGYPGPMEQVLDHLIGNALIHALAGVKAGVLHIEAHALDDKHLQLSISDNGCGIPPEIQHRIFEPFFTTRLGQGGSGLGLYLVFNLVTGLMGGHIEVQSSPGQGTRFRLTLPLQAPGAGAAAKA